MSQMPIFTMKLEPIDADRLPLTFGLSVMAQGDMIWPVANDPEHSLEIQLDDLFSYLVEFWKPLLLRQAYPFALVPARPSALMSAAARHWEDLPQEQIDEEASELDAFEDAHNLAHAFGGMFDLPPLWLVREGEHMMFDTVRMFGRLPFDAVLTELTRVGDEIATYLRKVDAAKWGRVVAAWENRDTGDAVNLLAWSASLEASVAEQLIGTGLVSAPTSFTEAANDNNELLIAARMAGALPTDQIVEILELARRFAHHSAETLDTLSNAALTHLRGLPKCEPFAEGEALANFVRDWFKISPTEAVDVFGIVEGLDIEIIVDAVGPITFDGLAIAGSSYGPGAFINSRGRRVRDGQSGDLRHNAGARVNLAHELCHLLVDREHPLSAVEVLRSRMPASIESRARAFAGEFLLPSSSAAKFWDEAGSPIEHDPLNAVLQLLVDHFEISFSVAAWKLQHGARWWLQHDPAKFRLLKSMLDELAIHR